MATYDVSEIEYGNNNYPLVDSKSRAALTTAINSENGRKNFLDVTSIYPRTQTIDGVVFTVNDDGSIDFDATGVTRTSTTYFYYIIPGGSSISASYRGMYIDTEFPTILTGVGPGGGSGGSLYELIATVVPTGGSSSTAYYQRNDTPVELPAGRIICLRLAVKAAFKKASSITPMLCYKDYYNLTSEYMPFKRTASDRSVASLIDSGNKNLIPHDAPSYSINNITWTNNGDGTWTVSTSAASSQYYGYKIVGNTELARYDDALPIPKGKYVLTGLPQGASSITYRYLLRIYTGSSASTSMSLYEDYAFEVTNDVTRFDLALYVATGVTIASPGVTYRPMLCLVDVFRMTTAFQPYRPPYGDFVDHVNTEEQIEVSALTELIDSGPKNVVNWSATSTTRSGVTFTVNSDGTVSTSGTASVRVQFGLPFTVPESLKAGRYVLSGCPPGGGNASGATTLYALYIYDVTANARVVPNYKDDNGNALEFDWTPDSTHSYNITVDIRKSTNATGLVFKPMICPIEYWKVTKAYQPYRPSYQELYDMVKALQA